MTDPSAPRRSWLRALGVAVLALLAVEAVLSLLFRDWLHPAYQSPVQEMNHLFEEHPARLWALAPGTHRVGGLEYAVNSLGLRDREPEGSGGVLFMGDSCTFGLGLPADRTVPALLQGALGGGVAVWNAGVPGYSSAQGRVHLEELLPRLRPRVVVLAYLTNDITEATMADHEALPGPLAGALRGLLRESSLFRLLQRLPETALADQARFLVKKGLEKGEDYLVEPFLADDGLPDEVDAEETPELVPWVVRVERERFRENALAMAALARASGARVVWLLLPEATEGAEARLVARRTALWEEARGLPIPMVDLPAAWGGDTASRRAFFQEDGFHPNEAGARRIAEDLAEALRREGAL